MLTGNGKFNGLAHAGGVPVGCHDSPVNAQVAPVDGPGETGGVVGAGVVGVVTVDVGLVGVDEYPPPPHAATDSPHTSTPTAKRRVVIGIGVGYAKWGAMSLLASHSVWWRQGGEWG